MMKETDSRNPLPTKIGKAMKAVLTTNILKAASIIINAILSRNLVVQLVRTIHLRIIKSLFV